jgi:hypothetical protein
MPNDRNKGFERIVYRDGQLLTAPDMSDEKSYEDRLRWLHVANLHATWGIVFGLTVSVRSGEKTVTVEPGYAVDDEGRDILLSEQMEIPIPHVLGAATLVLTASYQRDASFRLRSRLAQVCLREGASKLLEQPAFYWQQPTDLSFGPQIPLVKVELFNGILQGQPDFRLRRYARRESVPIIGWGNTEPGETGWVMGDQPQPPNDVKSLWLRIKVDTSEAGFTQTPHYFAFLRGYGVNNPDRLVTEDDIKAVRDEGQESAVFLNHLSFIMDPTVISFTYRILHRTGNLPGVPINDTQAEMLRWSIHWFGIEPSSDCPQMTPWFPWFSFFGTTFSPSSDLPASTV